MCSEIIKLKEITCKNALVKSRIPGVDYCLNPYVGCEHNCAYCYAIFMKRFTDHSEEWGSFVDVKINFLERLEKEVKKAKSGIVMLSSVTDAYQPIEEKYKLTRGALEILSGYDYSVSIQTKSDLVLRDIDILKKIKNCEVGFTITCLDENVQRKFEPSSPSTQERFKALKKLNEAGIDTFIFFGPVLPCFSDTEENIKIFEEIKDLHNKIAELEEQKQKLEYSKNIVRN